MGTSALTEPQEDKMAQGELDRSLTAMDWLPRLSVRGTLEGAGNNNKLSTTSGLLTGPAALRKSAGSPLEMTSLDEPVPPQKDGKPPYSYANLITFAINSSARKKMTLSEIYQWICDNFPYYKEAGNGWKVSVTGSPCHVSVATEYC